MTPATCRLCDGSGRLVLMRSWFVADGFTSTQCDICHGVGKTRDNAALDSASVKWQKHFRELSRAVAHD